MFSFMKWRQQVYFTVAIPAVQAPNLGYNRCVASLHFNYLHFFCLPHYTFQWMGEGRSTYRVLVTKREGRRRLGRPRLRWGDNGDNIKMDLHGVRGGTDWDHLAQRRDRWRALENAIMNLRDPWHAGNFLTSWEPISFSRKNALHWVVTHLSWHLNLSLISPLLLPLLISHSSINFSISFTNYM
jgi:hypothetical protein